CHGSDARGATGFPNLRDTDWLYGGEAETIKTTIMHGRQGMMPPWKDMLSNADATNVVDYVLSLSGRRFDQKAAESGKVKFEQLCIACHGADGTGNKAMGAPNLTDGTWLYGGSKSAIRTSILNGRNGNMPAMADFLGETRVHLLAAYIYSLSNESE
ncbi:MAG: c-type cytochrome, partial [Gammaproteobacteria bacterium]|nr:c-type cytochrome [Gammaproteobacteria bacterium]